MIIQRALFQMPLLKVKQTQFLALLQALSMGDTMIIQRAKFQMPLLKVKQTQLLALLQALSMGDTMIIQIADLSQVRILDFDGAANRAESVTTENLKIIKKTQPILFLITNYLVLCYFFDLCYAFKTFFSI